MDGIQALHDLLVKGGYYTKSVDDFRAQVKDPAYREKVQSVLKRDGAWSDGIADVLSSGGISMAPPPLKKKEQTMDLSSEDGSLESQESIVMRRPPEQEKFDIYSKIGQQPTEEKEELPKSFQNLDYSKGISSEEGIQSLFGQVKDKLKSAPVEDIVSFGNIAAKKSKEGKGSLTPFNQSSVGKVSGWINDIENGVEISPEDEKRWKEISPNSYNQTLNKSTVNKQIAPNEVSFEFAKSVNDVARINKKNIQDNDAKSGFDDIMESAKQLQSIGIDVANIGNVSTRNEMNKVQAMYDSRLKELQEKYPEVETEAMIEGGTVRVKGRGLKYSEDLRKLEDAKSYLLSNIGKIHAGKYALANPNLSSEQIGAEVLKIADPTTYKNYIQGGSESLDVKADIDRLGIQVLKSTNNPNLIKKAFEAEDVHDKKYPDEIIAETKRRLAVERAKDKGLSYIANLESITTSEADKYADQLQGKYKKAYMEIIRPQAIKETEAFLGKDSYAASKGNGVINLPPMGGAVNSLLGGVMQPVKGTYDFFADRVMPEKYVINKALAKNRNEFVNEDEVKRQIDVLLSKKDFTISDAKELERLNGELKTQLPYKALIDGTFELTGQVIAQAALTELGAGVVSSGAKGLALGSKLVGLRNTAAAVTNIARNAELVRDISGMAVGGLSSYSDAQKEAINLGLDGWKQNLYSATVAGLNVATERFFPDEKIFQAFMKDMSPLVGKMVRDMSSGSITESVLSSELKRAILSVAPKYLGNFVLENQKEAFEEAATQFGTSIAKGLLAPDKTNLENEINAVKQTYLETTIYGTLTGGIAAMKETKSNSVNTRSLFTLGQSSKDVQQFISIVNQRAAKGDITQEEADKKIKAATNIKDIVQTSIPAINQKKPLTDAEKIKLSSVLLAERTLKDDIENPQLEDVKSINQKQLKEVTDLKEKILNNEVVVDNDLNAYTPEEYKQKVKEDAVQEQTAGQVPVQPTAGVGQEMEGGVSEPKTVLTPEQKSEKEDQKSKLEELVNLIPTEDLRRPNGSIGTQGFTEENLVNVARFIASKMGFDIPTFNKDLGTSEIRQVIEYLRGNQEAQQKIKEYVIKDPVVTNLLPDGTYAVEDGNHRANLLNLIGVDVIPTIELNGRDKPTAINEHNAKVEAVEQKLRETAAPTQEQTQSDLLELDANEKEDVTFIDRDGNEQSVDGNEDILAELYHEALDVPENERTMAQQSAIDAVVSLETLPEVAPVEMHNEEQATAFEKKATEPMHKLVSSQAKNVLSALKSILPNLQLNIHEDENSYNSTMSKVKGTAGSRGNFHVDGNGNIRIDINLNKANARTIAHEAAHAVLYKMFGDNPRAFKVFHKQLANVISSMGKQDFIGDNKQITNVKSYLNKFVSRYQDKEARPEEYMAELSGILGDNAANLSVSGWRKIALMVRDFIDRVTDGKVKLFDNVNDTKDVVDFFNSMAQSFKTGEAVKAAPESITKKFGKVEAEKGEASTTEPINPNAPETGQDIDTSSLGVSKPSLIEELGLKRASNINKRIKTGVKLTDIGDVIAKLTFSDRLAAGTVGKRVYLGGILFSATTNRVWASFEKAGVSKIIKGMVKNKDGYRYLMPALLTETSHMSNKDMVNTAIEMVENSVVKNTISPQSANERIIKALKLKSIQPELLKIYLNNIEGKGLTSDLVKESIDKAILKSKSTFEERVAFLESLLGKADIDLTKRFGDLPSFSKLANGLAEPITDGHGYGDILLTIRTKGDLVAVQPKEGDADYHPSYPWVIRAVNPDGSIADVETLIFQKSYNAVDVFPAVTNGKGEKITYDDYKKKYGEDKAKSAYLGYMGARPTMATSVSESISTKAKETKPISKVKSESTKAKSKAQLAVHDETGFVSTDFWVNNLRGKTEYLDDVIKNILDAREELKKGEVKEDKVIKSYLITLASMGSGGGYYKKWADKTGKKISDIFLEKSNGKDWIRPEGSAAAYLITSDGKKLIEDVVNGTATTEQVKKMFDFVGIGKENQKTAYVIKTIANGGVKSMTDLFNKNKGSDFEELYKGAIKNLEGIGEGKTGFFNQYFGVASRGVVDARQLNAWVGGSMKLTPEQKEMVKKVSQSKKLSDQLLDRIKQVGIELGYSEDLAGYIAHHAIWDAIKNSITRHEGEYAVVSGKEISADDKKMVKAISKSSLVGSNAKLAEDIVRNRTAAIKLEKLNVDPKTIRLLTDWERGADGKWRYELDSSKSKMKVNVNDIKYGKEMKISDVISYPQLFKAYPELRNLKVIFEDDTIGEASFNPNENIITLGYDKPNLELVKNAPKEVIEIAKKYAQLRNYEKSLESQGIDPFSGEYWEKVDSFQEKIGYDANSLVEFGYAEKNPVFGFVEPSTKFTSLVGIIDSKQDINGDIIRATILHEIQHGIQQIEEFAYGGNKIIAERAMSTEERKEYNKAVWDMTKVKVGMKRNKKSTNDLTIEEIKILFGPDSYLHSIYKRLVGEVEARNVEKRMNMTAKQRRNTPIIETEDRPRSKQIFVDVDGNPIVSKAQLSEPIRYTKESGTTQVATTIGSYEKAAKIIKNLGVDSDVLDYGAGLGLGSDAMSNVLGFDVDSFEPNPERWKGKKNVTFKDSRKINKKYNSIVSLNVLNVVEKDTRDSIVKDIYNNLNDGGVAVISTRKWNGDVNQAKNAKNGEEKNSLYITKNKDGKNVEVFQKGFDGDELVNYIKDILGDKVTIEKNNSFGATGVVIKKEPVSKAQLSNEAEKKKLISDLKKKANKAISKVIESTFDTNTRNKRFLEIQTILADKIKEVQDMKPVSKAQLSEEADGKNWKSKIYKEALDAKDINSLRASLRKKAPNSYTLDILDEIANGMKNNEGSEDPDVDSFISEGITLSNIKNMLIEDDVFENPKDVDNYFVSIGGQDSKGIFNRLSGAKSTPVSKSQVDAPASLRGVNYSDIVVGDKYLEDILSDNKLSEDEKQQVREIFARGVDYFKFDKEGEQKFQEKFANPEDITDVADIMTGVSAANQSAFNSHNKKNYDNVKDAVNYIASNPNDYSPKVVKAVKEIKEKLGNPSSSMNRLYAIDIMKELGLKETPVSKAQLSEEELPGYNNMMSKVQGIVDKKLERQKKLTPDEENFDKIKYKKERLQAALDYVMQSKVYEDANDVQRDQIVRDVRKSLGFREKSAPGGASDLFIGIGRIIKMAKEKKMVTMTQTQFFYEQMNQLVRGGRDAKVAVRKVQKEISESMRALVNAGQLSSKQAAAIVRMYSKTNLLKPESVQRFIDYMAKVFANADYASKVSIAKNLKSKISELSNDKSKNPDLRAMATRFNQIDPTMVDDIDAYNELASKLVSGLTGSKIVGEDMKWAQGVSILGVRNYVDAAIKSQQEKKRQMLVNEMQVLLGIDASDMTYEDLKLFIEKEKEPESKEKEKIKRDNLAKKIEERLGIDTSGMTYKELKSLLIKSTISRAFNANSSVIKYMLYSGKDPFTEYPVTFTEQQKDILRRFIDMDLNLLTEKESIDAIDKLNLFLQNQGDFRSTAGMESILAKYDAEKNLRELINSNVLAPTIRKYFSPRAGRILLEQIVTVPMMFERLFKGVTMGGKVQEMSGVTKTINGKAIAERMARRIDTEYVLKFFKKKPNGESFNTAKNNIERGMAAFMMRNVIGTEQQMKDEFERRRGHIEKSIELLKKGDEVENKKADEYQEAYDKIVKDSKNIQDIKDSIDPINLNAIEWWSSKWDEHYPEMASVAANVYNKLLDKDINFNPDRYKRISTDTDKVNLTNDDSVFDFNNGTIYKKEAGSLLEAQRLTPLPANDKGETNRYIDFSFDSNNSNAMYDALVDIKTAASIRQVDAFINSDNFYKLFKNRADGDVVKDRLKLMVNNIRDKSPFTKRDEAAKLIASINRLASVGVGQALGGVTQPLKQMGPIALNTLINAGGLHLGIMFDPARKKFIDESGYAIANRGIEAQTQIASLNKLINEAANSKGEKAMRLIEKANELQLKIFLVAPDVYIAKASWFAYYEQALKKQGIKNVDYDTHKINKKAADYAQMMVDRQQNISDHDLAGKLYSESGNDYKNIFVKMLLAFSSFRMNTSSRLANDLSVFEYWNTSTKEDKIIALRSLSGYAVETVAFRLISLYVGVLTQQVVNYIRGTDDDEEDEKKQSNNLKGQATTGIVEMLSPFPLVDKLVQLGVYTTLDLLQSDKEEDEKFNIFPVKADEEFFRSLGLFGIAAAKGVQIGKLINLAATGEFVDDYTKDTKYLKESDKDLAGALIFPSLLGAAGVIPSAELNSIVNKSIKDMKKDASTNNPDEVTAGEREKMQELKQLQYLKDNYDLSQDEESFVNTEILERSLDIAPERDIKAEKELKKIKEVDKEWKKRLLGDYYSSEEQMKKFDPEKYEELFGKGSDWDEKHQAEKEVNKTWQKIKKKINWD